MHRKNGCRNEEASLCLNAAVQPSWQSRHFKDIQGFIHAHLFCGGEYINLYSPTHWRNMHIQ